MKLQVLFGALCLTAACAAPVRLQGSLVRPAVADPYVALELSAVNPDVNDEAFAPRSARLAVYAQPFDEVPIAVYAPVEPGSVQHSDCVPTALPPGKVVVPPGERWTATLCFALPRATLDESKSFALTVEGRPTWFGLDGTLPKPKPDEVEPTVRVEPAYPMMAAYADLQGSVAVIVEVDEAGEVTRTRVVAAQPAGVFDDAAVAALRQWRYVRRANGRPGKLVMTQWLTFPPDGRASPKASPPKPAPNPDAEAIAAAVRDQEASLGVCLDVARATEEIAAGPYTFTFDWDIEPSGAIASPRLTGPSGVLSTSLAPCFAQMMSGWKFSERKARAPIRDFPVSVTLP